VLITFHSSFKLRGVAGYAYWSMIAVVLSGIVGRYLYGRIPRKLGAVEMSVDEAEQLCADPGAADPGAKRPEPKKTIAASAGALPFARSPGDAAR